MLKKLRKIGRLGYRGIFAAVLTIFALKASADYLWWTVDFNDDWGNEGELQSNPAGEGVEGYDLYLVIEDSSTGSWIATHKGGELVADAMDNPALAQLPVDSYTGSEYLFFVEMVKSGESAQNTQYLSQAYTYAELQAAGFISTTMETFDMPWNAAVGGAWAVPEPSSGLLLLIGTGLLALRRKEKTL